MTSIDSVQIGLLYKNRRCLHLFSIVRIGFFAGEGWRGIIRAKMPIVRSNEPNVPRKSNKNATISYNHTFWALFDGGLSKSVIVLSQTAILTPVTSDNVKC